MIRLANLPVITVAAIRGIASGGGAEIAAGLDVRFGSLEKAVFTQNEVGVGESLEEEQILDIVNFIRGISDSKINC